jgi:hypothetical protein
MAELSSQSTSIQTIYSMFSDEKLFVNRRYQRKLVWTLQEKQKLVESIQKNIQSRPYLSRNAKRIQELTKLLMGYNVYTQLFPSSRLRFLTLPVGVLTLSIFRMPSVLQMRAGSSLESRRKCYHSEP